MRELIETVTTWDVRFFTSIFRLNRRKMLATIVPVVSHTGDGTLYLLLPLVVAWLAPDALVPFTVAGVVAFAIELPVYRLVKHWVRRDRPFVRLPGITGRIVPADRFSFPSGHTAAAFVVLLLVGWFFPAALVLLVPWAWGVAFSRIYLGVHYPSDTIAGMVLGLISAGAGLAVVFA